MGPSSGAKVKGDSFALGAIWAEQIGGWMMGGWGVFGANIGTRTRCQIRSTGAKRKAVLPAHLTLHRQAAKRLHAN